MSEEEPRQRKFWKFTWTEAKPISDMSIEELEREAKSNRNTGILLLLTGLAVFLMGGFLDWTRGLTMTDTFLFATMEAMTFLGVALSKVWESRLHSRADTLEFFDLTMKGNESLLKGMEALGRRVSKLTEEQKKRLTH